MSEDEKSYEALRDRVFWQMASNATPGKNGSTGDSEKDSERALWAQNLTPSALGALSGDQFGDGAGLVDHEHWRLLKLAQPPIGTPVVYYHGPEWAGVLSRALSAIKGWFRQPFQ